MERVAFRSAFISSSTITNTQLSKTSKISLFGSHSHSEKWHKAIEIIAANKSSPLNGSVLDEDVLRHLRLQTELYLKSKKKITSEEVDIRLAGLIRTETHKDLAVAACAHQLTALALRAVLGVELRQNAGDAHSTISLLRAVIVAHLISPFAATFQECRVAQALLPYFGKDTLDLKAAMGILLMDVPAHSLLYEMTENLGLNACRKFISELKELAGSHQWAEARRKTSFLSSLAESALALPSGSLLPNQVLQKGFGAWKAWSCWKPDPERLRLFDGLTKEERNTFSDFLVLEGPDIVTQCEQTLRDGLAKNNTSLLSWKNTKVRIHSGSSAEVKDVLGRLSSALDLACKGNPSDRKLLAYLFIGRDIELEGLLFWEKATSTTVTSMSEKILRFFKVEPAQNFRNCSDCANHLLQAESKLLDEQHDSTLQLFATLRDPSADPVRQLLASFLAHRATKVIQTMQTTLTKQLDKKMLASTAERLQAFGAALKEDDWIFMYFSQHLALLLHAWPGQAEIADLENLRTAAQIQLSANDSTFVKGIQTYLMHRLVAPEFLEDRTVEMVTKMVDLWRQPGMNEDAKAVSIWLCQDRGPSWALRFRCLSQIPSLSASFQKVLRRSLAQKPRDPDQNCLDFVAELRSLDDATTIECWRPCLTRMFVGREKSLIEYTIEKLGAGQWLKWILEIGQLYNDVLGTDNEAMPTILRSAIHDWVKRISPLSDIIQDHWRKSQLKNVVKTILFGYKAPSALDHFERIPTLLNKAFDKHGADSEKKIILDTVCQLAEDGSNAKKVADAIEFMSETSADGMEACGHVMDIHKHEKESTLEDESANASVTLVMSVSGKGKAPATSPKPLTSVIFGAVLYGPNLTQQDQLGLKAFGDLLGLQPLEDDATVFNGLEAAADYLEAELAALLEEARKLESLRLGYKATNPLETEELFKSLGIENPSRLDDEMTCLPSHLVDVIEQITDTEVELHFPLTSLSKLQRAAMGVGSAQNMIVRLSYAHEVIEGFCIHLDNELKDLDCELTHFYMNVFEVQEEDLDAPTCYAQPTRISYQLTRALVKYLSHESPATKKSPELSEIYELISGSIPEFGQQCMVCETTHTDMYRSALCQSVQCGDVWRRAHYNLLLSDVAQDPEMVDLLLTMVHCAAKTSNAALLPNSPVTDPANVLQLLAKLPQLLDLKDNDDVYSALKKKMGQEKEVIDFLIWILHSYRGFITSATGKLRIPSLPGSHQFLLANTNPEAESAFTKNLGNQTSSVFFHGTAPDRMLSILQNGLRNCSGTTLQKHGASHGNGVYLAAEPATSMGYCTSIPSPAGTGWRHSAYVNCRFLLGVEHAGPSVAKYTGIHVIPDPTMLVIRYIFLLPLTTNAPIANHVVPAMSSVFASLRTKAL